MADTYKGLYVKFGGDATGLTKALKEIDSEASSTQRSLNAISKCLKFQPGNTTLLTQQMQQYEKRIEQTKQKLEVLKSEQAKLGERNDLNAEAWDKLERDIIDTTNVLEKYEAKLVDCKAAMSKLGQAGTAITQFGEKLEPIGQKIEAIGSKWTRTITLGIVAGSAVAVKAAVDVDTALTGVRKTVDATEDEYQAMKDAAIEFSKTNAVSATQILDLQALGAQLGWNKESLVEFSEVVSGLDIATDMSAEQAATELAQFANITRMAQKDASNYASTIVDLGNNMATTESAISDMGMRTAAASTQVGMSVPEILGWSAAMASMGVEAEAGGTAFSKTVATIDSEVATGGKHLETFAKIAGMSADEFKRSWQTSASDTLIALLKGTDGAENMTVALEEMGITGIRQSDVLKRLAGNTDLVSKALGVANRGWSENTALSKEVANRNDSLAAKFEMLKNKLTAIAVEIGEPIANALIDAIDAAQPLIDAIEGGAEAFSDMSESEQTAVITTIALVAAFGPMLSMLGRGMQVVKPIGEGLSGLARMIAKTEAGGSKLSSLIGKIPKGAGLAAAGLGSLAVIVASLAAKCIDAAMAQGRLNSALSSLSSATNAPMLSNAARGIDEVTNAASRHASVSELARSMEELSESVSGIYQQAGGEIAVLESYMDTIETLGGRSDLTSDQVNDLKLAVEHVNDACGTSAEVMGDNNEVVEKAGDAYENATQKLRDYVDAKEAQIRADAYAASLQKMYEKQGELQADLAEKTAAVASAQELYNKSLSDPIMANNQTIYAKNLADAKSAQNAAQESLDAYNGTMDDTTRAMRDNEAVANKTADAWQRLAAKLPALRSAFASDDAWEGFKRAIGECGVTVEQFAALTESEQLRIANAFDGTNLVIDDEIAKLLDLKGIKVGDKRYYVSDNGSIYDQNGKLQNLNRFQIGAKRYFVTDDGTVFDEFGKVYEFDEFDIDGKHYFISNDGTIRNEKGEVVDLSNTIRGVPTSWTTEFKVNVRDAINNLGLIKGTAYAVQQYIASYGATGAYIAPHAAGAAGTRARLHASGFSTILTRPTVIRASRSAIDIGGEAGAEYWEHGADGSDTLIPLTNRRHMVPIAREISRGINLQGSGEKFDYSRMGDEMAMAIEGMELSVDRRRLGRIVRKVS